MVFNFTNWYRKTRLWPTRVFGEISCNVHFWFEKDWNCQNAILRDFESRSYQSDNDLLIQVCKWRISTVNTGKWVDFVPFVFECTMYTLYIHQWRHLWPTSWRHFEVIWKVPISNYKSQYTCYKKWKKTSKLKRIQIMGNKTIFQETSLNRLPGSPTSCRSDKPLIRISK